MDMFICLMCLLIIVGFFFVYDIFIISYFLIYVVNVFSYSLINNVNLLIFGFSILVFINVSLIF